MRKLIILLLCAWLLQSCADAFWQSNKSYLTKDVKFLAGAGKSGVGGPESGESWEDPVGFQIGVETKLIELNDNSSLSTGINLSLQGAAYTEQYDFSDPYYGNALKSATFNENELSGKVTLAYLNIPFLYSYQSNGGFYGEVGLQPGFLISAKDKIDGGESYDYKNQVKAFELGLPIGIGYKINDQFSVGARATWGLTNMSDSGSGDKDHNWLAVALFRYNIGSIINK